MAREALTIVGGVAGFMLGGPEGAMLGMALGAMLGGMIDPIDPVVTSGPRLGDLKVQVSTWGTRVPVMWGSMRMAGNVIWAMDLIESSTTTSSGGKGMGGGQESTTYSYSANFAVAVCEGEITGVRKIWANGKLIYSIASDADVDTMSASSIIAAKMKIYTGSETQLADPTMEADKGVGNVPGYRGIAYIVFDGLELADYGNRIPNLEFEVIKSGVYSYTGSSDIGVGSGVAVDPLTGYIWTVRWDGTDLLAKVYDPSSDALIATINCGANAGWNRSIVYVSATRMFWLTTDNNIYTAGYIVNVIDPDSMTMIYQNDTDYGGAVAKFGGCVAYNVDKSVVLIGVGNGIGTGLLGFYEDDFGVPMERITDKFGAVVVIDLPDLVFYQLTMPDIHRIAFIGYGNWISIIDTQSGIIGYNLIDLEAASWSSTNQQGRLAYDSKRQKIFWGSANTDDVYIVDPIALTVSVAITGIYTRHMWYDTDEDTIYIDTGTDILLYNPATYALIDTYTAEGIATSHSYGQAIYLSSGTAYGVTTSQAAGSEHLYKYALGKRLAVSTILLSEVVTDICAKSGLTAGQIDVTALTDVVDGYAVHRTSTGRAALLQLQKAYFFDAVESDNKLKFVKRGGAAVNVPYTDIGAYEYGSESAEPLTVQRMQEVELPETVNINFYNQEADHLLATESSRRLVTTSKRQVVEDLALNLTPAKAAVIADILMYTAHVGRTSFQFSTSRKYAKYEPTDVFSITKNNITYRIRLIKKEESGSLINWTGIADNASVMTSSAIAGTQQTITSQITVPGATRAEYLDIPIVQSGDDNAGFYVAVGGYKPAWDGAGLFRSSDGVAYTDVGSALNEAAIGTASTALGSWAGMNFPDETNSVTVFMTSGTLSSITNDQLYNGGNAAVIGDELIHFRDATLIATDTYTLTGILRGRNGTDQYLNTHIVGERFVVMTVAGIMRPNEGLGGINAERFYKPVSFGASLAQTLVKTFTNTGAGLKPLAPMNVGAVRQLSGTAANDWNIRWSRCGRKDTAWRDLTDVAVNEDTEEYEIDIMSGVNVKRTITIVNAELVTYTSAQQTTDFGSAQSTITFNLYQMSAQVGRGFVAAKTF
jgi:hypothetical protein